MNDPPVKGNEVCTVVVDCLEGGAVRGSGRVPEPWTRFGTGPDGGKGG
jgi:hypothetical protein